jgi:hypothetical protein
MEQGNYVVRLWAKTTWVTSPNNYFRPQLHGEVEFLFPWEQKRTFSQIQINMVILTDDSEGHLPQIWIY